MPKNIDSPFNWEEGLFKLPTGNETEGPMQPIPGVSNRCINIQGDQPDSVKLSQFVEGLPSNMATLDSPGMDRESFGFGNFYPSDSGSDNPGSGEIDTPVGEQLFKRPY